MKKILVLVLCLALALGMLTACGGGEKPANNNNGGDSGSGEYKGPEMELTVNMSSPEDYAEIYKAAFDRVSERTDGKVKFIMYYSGSLLSAADSLDGLGTGMADFSDVTLTNFQDQFPYTEQVVSYPFMEFNNFNMAAEIMNDVILNNDLMMEEFKTNNIQPLFFVGVWGTSMVFADDIEITTPDSVKGLKLVTLDQNFSRFLRDVGATPVSQPPPEYFASLTNGVADGVVNGLNIVNIFGALDPAKVIYMFENSLSTSVKTVAANKDTWDGLDPSLQAIIMDEMQGEELFNHGVKFWAASDQNHLDKAEELGIPVKNISGDQMQAWKDAMKKYGDEKIQQLIDKGYTEAQNVLDIWNDAIKEYNERN